MKCRAAQPLFPIAWLALALPHVLRAVEPPGAAYVQGIEALGAADYKNAVGLLTRAVAEDEENPACHRARGVARTLAEDFPAAIADLERAMRLDPGDKEARLWLATACKMGGHPEKSSLLFTFSGVPRDYADMIYNVMATDYWSSKTHGSYYDRETNRQVAVKEPIRKLFPEAAKAYADRHRATGAAANEVVLNRMRTALRRGEWNSAWKDLDALRRNLPDDPVLRGDAALCLLGLGDALHARREFTRVLCVLPLWIEGYLGRAEAAAILGDSRRAGADLATAAALGGKVDGTREKVKACSGIAPATADALAGQAAAGAPIDALAATGLALHRAFDSKRLRYDEGYQDRVLAFSDAIRARPAEASRHERLGRFLFNHHVAPSAWAGPRSTEQLRPQSPGEQADELRRAVACADDALKLDARHVNALATKALVLHRTGRVGEAQSLSDRGLEIEPRNVRLLTLKSRILQDQAGQMLARAAGLRSGRTETTEERRGDGVYRVTRHYPPTPQELAEARALEERAAALQREAGRLNTEAARIRTEVVPALLSKGRAEEAESLDPERDDVSRALEQAARTGGDPRAARGFALLAEPLRHSTAAEQLKLAWQHIVRTAWKSAGEALDEAERIDPVDARIAAYRGIIAAARSDAAAARQQRLVALGLEEGRARLMGTSFSKPGGAPLSLDEIGLTLLVRLREAEALTAEGRHDRAREEYAANVSAQERLGREHLVMQMPGAMLPDPASDPHSIPQAPTFASLMAWSRIGTARSLLALNRPAEAHAQFLEVRRYLANWPATARDRETMNAADAWARLGLAEAAFAAKNHKEAFMLLHSGEGWPMGLPQDLEQRRKALSREVIAARDKAEDDERRAEENMTPAEMIARRNAEDIAAFQQQRDSAAAELQKPGLSEAERRALEAIVTELDRMIAQRKGQPVPPRTRPEPFRPRTRQIDPRLQRPR